MLLLLDAEVGVPRTLQISRLWDLGRDSYSTVHSRPPFNGFLGELIILNSSSGNDRGSINYLSYKWGLGANSPSTAQDFYSNPMERSRPLLPLTLKTTKVLTKSGFVLRILTTGP